MHWRDASGNEHFTRVDTVLYGCGSQSNTETVEMLHNCCSWFVVTGDAKEPRQVKQAA